MSALPDNRVTTLARNFRRFDAKLQSIGQYLTQRDRRDIADAKTENNINTFAATLEDVAREYERRKTRVQQLEDQVQQLLRNNPAPNTAALERRISELDLANRRLQDTNDDLLRQLLNRPPLPPPPINPYPGQQGEIDYLRRERDDYKAERDAFKAERDRYKTQRDRYKTERDGFERQRDDLQKKVDDFASRPLFPGCSDCKAHRNHMCGRWVKFKNGKRV